MGDYDNCEAPEEMSTEDWSPSMRCEPREERQIVVRCPQRANWRMSKDRKEDQAEVQKITRTASTRLKELPVQRVAVDLKQVSIKP